MLRTLLCTVLLALAAPALAQSPSAILMAVDGDVQIARGDERLAGEFGLQLEAGAVISTGDDSECDILFANGQSVHLGPNTRMTVQGAARGNADGEAESGDFAAASKFISLKGKRGSSLVAQLRSEGVDPLRPIDPMQTALRETRPAFRWAAPDDAVELKLSVRHEGDVVWETMVPAETTELVYPEDAPELPTGKQYSWALETTDPLMDPPARSAAAYFEILTPAVTADLESQLEALQASDLSTSGQAILGASILYNHGAHSDAIQWTRMALAEQDHDGLREILAQLYVETGRNAEAIALLEAQPTP